MKLKECKDWKVIHFNDRAILKVDKPFYGKAEWDDMLNLSVEKMGVKGHCKVSK